jgi:hypothetical protein
MKMRILYGKGVWAWREGEVPTAIRVARAIGARIVLFKTGQEGEYFARAARRVVRWVTDAGLIPCAWPVITCHDPDAEADVAIQTILDGYVGLVFDIERPASGQHAGAVRLGEIMTETGLPQEVMFFTSLPNISANLDIPYGEMGRFCRGGFMPQSYATFGWSAQYMFDVITYREFRLWTQERNLDLPIYPVLGLYRDEHGEDRLSLVESRPWLDALARYRPTFFSVYRAGVLPERIWPLLAAFETTPRGQSPPPPPTVEGHYITVQPGETLSRLCTQYGCTLGQFFAWNGHLWDARGKELDPRTLEYGWVVRVR